MSLYLGGSIFRQIDLYIAIELRIMFNKSAFTEKEHDSD